MLGQVNGGALGFYTSLDRGSTWTSLGMPTGIIGGVGGMVKNLPTIEIPNESSGTFMP